MLWWLIPLAVTWFGLSNIVHEMIRIDGGGGHYRLTVLDWLIVLTAPVSLLLVGMAAGLLSIFNAIHSKP